MWSIDGKMAWRNLWRNPRRTILTICAVVFACVLLVFMLSWQFGSYETMINAAVRIHTGHLQVQASGYLQKKSMRLVVSEPDAVGRILDPMLGVDAYTYRANAFSLASSKERTYGVLVIGVQPEREARVSTLKKLVREGAYLSDGDVNQAILGKLLAKNLRVGLGDEVTLLGQGRDGSIAATVVRVKGIYSAGQDEFDRSFIHIPLALFQDVYAMGGAVHEVIVLCNSLEQVAPTKQLLARGLESIHQQTPLVALDWQELIPGLLEGIKIDLAGGLIMYFILILVVAFSILNTFLMAIFERTREFGMLMAIGTSPGRLTRLLLMESMAMGLIGIAAGTVGGTLVTWYFQVHGIHIAGASEILQQYGISGAMYPRISWLSASIGPAAVLVITFLTALYPALKIRKLRPVEAMVYV